MLQQMHVSEGVLFSLQIGFKVDFYFYQVCFLPTDYPLWFINHILTNKRLWLAKQFIFTKKLFYCVHAKTKLENGKLCASQQKAISRCWELNLTFTELATVKIYLPSQGKRKYRKKRRHYRQEEKITGDLTWVNASSQKSNPNILYEKHNYTQEF